MEVVGERGGAGDTMMPFVLGGEREQVSRAHTSFSNASNFLFNTADL